MKEIFLETKIEELNFDKNTNEYKESIFNSFFFFRFLNLLKLSKKRKINFEDITRINKEINTDEIISDISDIDCFLKSSELLNSLVVKNKSKIYYIVFLSSLRIILMILNPFLFKQFAKANINFLYLIFFILILDFFRTSLSLRIELNSHELSLSIDKQIKQIIIKNDLINKKNNDNLSNNEKIALCNNIFNNDIETIKHFFYLFPNFFSIPLLFFSYYLVLYFLFGFTSLFSFLLLILIIFINIKLQGKLKQGQKAKQNAIDERMKFMTSLIYNLKNIKILLYEKFFYNKIMEKRNKELKQYEILYQTANKIRSLLWASPTLLILLTIICHIFYSLYNNIPIKVENLLIIFGLIDSFQQPILTFCQTYSSYLISKVCSSRIEKYLSTQKNKNDCLQNFSNNIYDDIAQGKNEIIFIIGDTGSGKSFLLKNIYNEFKNKNNNNNIHIIYNGQESFIMNDTIQSNIFFMKEKNSIEEKAYLNIINNSCLENDLSLAEKGDLTQTGENGCHLSGGQKKRICIARTLLDAENNKLKKQILFFDEPTYSLDPETLVNVWNKSFIGFLNNTTRIIVTNNLDLIKYGNKIIYVENKKIIFYGSYPEFQNNKDIYEKYIKLDNLFKERNQIKKGELNLFNKNINNLSHVKSTNVSSSNNIMNNNKNKINIYNAFIKILIGGYKNFFILIIILIVWIILRFFSEYFLFLFKNNNSFDSSIKNLIYVYIIINIFSCILLYIRLVLTSKFTISGGKTLHESMLQPIINFKKIENDSNQFINIFSRDLPMVDFFSSVMFGNCLTFGGAFISLLLVIIKFFNIFLIFIPIFIFVGFFLTNIYLGGFRQLVQLDNQMRSNIINFIKEINLGKEEIESYRVSDKFLKKFKELYIKYYFSNITSKYFIFNQ